MNGKPWMKAINGMNDSRSEREWVIAFAIAFHSFRLIYFINEVKLIPFFLGMKWNEMEKEERIEN